MAALLTKLVWSRWLHIDWPSSLLRVYWPRQSLGSITSRCWGNELALVPRTDGPARLFSRRPERAVEIGTRQSQPSWSNKIGQKENFNLGTNTGNPEYLARSGSQSEWRIRFIFLARGFCHIRRVLIDLVTCLLMFVHYLTGLTAFDFISDFEEWIECGYFNEEIKARLKGKPSIHERLSLEKPVAKLSLHLCLPFLLFQWVIIELFTWEQQTEKDKEDFGEFPFLF